MKGGWAYYPVTKDLAYHGKYRGEVNFTIPTSGKVSLGETYYATENKNLFLKHGILLWFAWSVIGLF